MWYNDIIMQLFLQPQHAGQFATETANVFIAHAGNPGQSDTIQLQIILEKNTISDAKFKIQGGVATIAAAEYIAGKIKNKTVDELLAIDSHTIINALKLPEQHYNAAALAGAALQQLIEEIKNDRYTV